LSGALLICKDCTAHQKHRIALAEQAKVVAGYRVLVFLAQIADAIGVE